MAAIGSVIDGKYEILKLIGKGGMSKVYLAMDMRLHKRWAIKEIINGNMIQGAIAEANMLKNLDHIALPRIVDIIEKENTIYLVMDYIEGESLDKIIKRDGAQSQEQVIEWGKELCGVLMYLHTRTPAIIHRDMKPSNIMLKVDGTLKLIDFGIAREYKESQMDDTVSLGTRGYAAPEQFFGNNQSDVRTDIYSLGATLHHLVIGKSPYEPPFVMYPIRHWNDNLSEGLEQIIQKCVEQNPDARYQSCEELMYALNHYEDMDNGYKRILNINVKKLFYTIIISGICFGLGIGTNYLNNKRNISDYERNMMQAGKEISDEKKIRLYMDAIALKPEVIDAYMEYVRILKSDATFTMEEEVMLSQTLNQYFDIIRKNPKYPDLAFEIGKLYWYYYEYGSDNGSDNQLTRMKSAIQWFDDAITYGNDEKDYYGMAVIYKEIGIFHRDITLNVTEGNDEGIYEEYYQRIKDLFNNLKYSQNESEIVKLELYRLILYSMENYVQNFRKAGIEFEDIQGLYQEVQGLTQEISTNTEVTENMRKDLIVRFESVQKLIYSAYGKE